jgi:hypothetical protein
MVPHLVVRGLTGFPKSSLEGLGFEPRLIRDGPKLGQGQRGRVLRPIELRRPSKDLVGVDPGESSEVGHAMGRGVRSVSPAWKLGGPRGGKLALHGPGPQQRAPPSVDPGAASAGGVESNLALRL